MNSSVAVCVFSTCSCRRRASWRGRRGRNTPPRPPGWPRCMAAGFGGAGRCTGSYRGRIRAPTDKICVELGKQEGNISSRSRISVSWTVTDLHCKTVYARPSLGRIFFIFMQFSANFGQIIGWHPLSNWHPLWKILDPPLLGSGKGGKRGLWCPCIRIDFMSSPPSCSWTRYYLEKCANPIS